MPEKTAVSEAVSAARTVMAAHLEALNARDADALAATLHFPHYRLAGNTMTVWQTPDTYLSDFYNRAGGEWHHSTWDNIDVVQAAPGKVHLNVTFTRHRSDDTPIATYRSL